MRVTIRQKNLIVTPPLKVYIESKLLRPIRELLGKMSAGELPILDLEVGRLTRHHQKGRVYKVAASLTFGKTLLRSEAEDEDIRACCDLVREELEREIIKFKDRSTAKNRRTARKFKKDFKLNKAARLYRKGRIRSEGN